MPSYDEIIEQSQENIKVLSVKLKEIDSLYNDINTLTTVAKEIPDIFNNKFEEIIKVTDSYTNSLGISTKKFLDGNNALFVSNLQSIQKEVGKLENVDFTLLFKDLQEVFIKKTKTDLDIELRRFEEQALAIHSYVNELNKQVERLKKIDLKEHFDELQKTLSEIFRAVNSINITLSGLTQNFTGLTKSIGALELTINKNHQAIVGLIDSSNQQVVLHLTKQDEDSKRSIELLLSKLQGLDDINQLLKKEIKINRKFQIIGVVIVLVAFISIAFLVGL